MSSLPIFLFNDLIVNAGSMGGDITSQVEDISEASIIAIQGVWSAGSTPVGVMIVQASLDNITFTDINSLTVSGNTGSNMFNIDDPGYRYIRLFYDRTSGSGTLNVRMTAKRI